MARDWSNRLGKWSRFFLRDARATRIDEGTSEIQRLAIARDVLERGI